MPLSPLLVGRGFRFKNMVGKGFTVTVTEISIHFSSLKGLGKGNILCESWKVTWLVY